MSRFLLGSSLITVQLVSLYPENRNKIWLEIKTYIKLKVDWQRPRVYRSDYRHTHTQIDGQTGGRMLPSASSPYFAKAMWSIMKHLGNYHVLYTSMRYFHGILLDEEFPHLFNKLFFVQVRISDIQNTDVGRRKHIRFPFTLFYLHRDR